MSSQKWEKLRFFKPDILQGPVGWHKAHYMRIFFAANSVLGPMATFKPVSALLRETLKSNIPLLKVNVDIGQSNCAGG